MNKQTKEDIKDWLKILGIFLCGFLFAILFITLISADTQDNFVSAVQLQQVKTLAQENADAHEWVFGKFMCGDFVGKLSIKLHDANINMNMKSGKWFQNGDGTCSALNYRRFRCKHYWLEAVLKNGTIIPVESVGGYIIPMDEYRRDYK